MAMMKITIISVGKLKEPPLQDMERIFLTRLGPMAKITIIEIPEEYYSKSSQAPNARKKEATKIQGRIKPGAYVIALDERGKQINSEKFSHSLADIASNGTEVIFIVGGSSGLDESIRSQADTVLSLSSLTFPHQLARVILIEQIYRAMTIRSGKIYHK